MLSCFHNLSEGITPLAVVLYMATLAICDPMSYQVQGTDVITDLKGLGCCGLR